MKLWVHARTPGEIPWGALVMLPLFAMPMGGWLVEQGHVDFGVCAMKSTLGIPCLSCGATRATLHLLHAEWADAWAMQPLVMVIYALVALWGGTSLVAFAANRSIYLQASRREEWAFKGALVILPLVNWAYLIAAGV